MNRKKQKKLNSLNYQRTKNSDSNKDEAILNIEFIENLSLFKFKQLLNSASSKDVERALYSIIKTIRDEKEKSLDEDDQDDDEEIKLNYKNKNLSVVFEYLKQSPQLTELFTIWDTCIDKYQVYQTCYALLLEFLAIIITLNDDPALQFQTRILADRIITNRFLDLQKIINSYSDETVNLTLNCYRLLSSIVPLSIKIAKSLQTNIDFSSNAFQEAMTDIPSNGAYLGTRPYVLRFLLSFLKHHNLKLSEFILESEYLLSKYCHKIQLDHHNVILDLIESLETNILKVDIIPKKLKIKFFSPSFLSKIGLVFSKDDIGEESRQSIYKFLTTLCCSPIHGICSSDPKWTWFRENDLPSFENKSIVSLITELNPIAYQTHQSLFIKIINACPDLFTSYLKKLGSCEVSLSLNWLNRTTMLIKTLSSPVPTAPVLKITNKLSESIPSSPMVLINLLVPPQVSNLSFGFEVSNLVTYNQLLVLQLCLKRVNTVLSSLNHFLIEKQQQQEDSQKKEKEIEVLIGFIENLKNGIKERLPSFRYFKEHCNEFKSSSTTYDQYISIISEYVKFLPINEFLTLKMLDFNLIVKSDLYTQKQFIQLIGCSKSFNTIQNLFNKQDSANCGTQSIINMVLKLYMDSKPEIKELYHQLIFKLISINNIFSSVDGEIDYWLEFISLDNIEFFEATLLNAHQNKFNYVNLIQNLTKKLFGSNSNQLYISPVLVSAIFQLFTGLHESQFRFLSQVLTNVSSLSKNNSLLILSILNFINQQKTKDKVEELNESNIYKELESNDPFKFNLPAIFNSAIKFIYYQSFNKSIEGSNDKMEDLAQLVLDCQSPKEIKYIISNNVNQTFLTLISSKDNEGSRFIQAIKFIPVHLLLSQFNLIDSENKKQTIVSNQIIKSQLINSISNLSIRKLINILPILENLINNQFKINTDGNQVDQVFGFYFDIAEIVFKLVLESKSLNGIRSIEQFLSNSLISSNYLINFKLTFNVSKLILVIFNFNKNNNNNLLNNILSPFITNIFNQINKKSIKESSKAKNLSNQFILSIRVLELVLPYLDFKSCVQLLEEFKDLDIKSLTNESILQIYLEIINSLLRITSNNNNTNILPKYLTVFNFGDTSNNNIINSSNNGELLKSIFIQLIEISLSFDNNNSNNNNLIYKITIDQFIYQFLLNDINQINLSVNYLNSLLYSRKELISKYLNYCLENYSPVTSQNIIIILLVNSLRNSAKEEGQSIELNLNLLDFNRLLKFDVTIWLPLMYWLVIKESKDEILGNETLLNQIYESISQSNIFERDINSSLISITLELFKFISNKLQATTSKLNYLLLFTHQENEVAAHEFDNSVLKSMVSNYSNSLLICIKNNFKDLLNLNIANLGAFKANSINFENIIKLIFSNINSEETLSQNLEIIEKIIEMESSFKYQLYIDLIFKSIINSDFILNIIKSEQTQESSHQDKAFTEEEEEEESSIIKFKSTTNNNNNYENLLKYRLLNILLNIYYKEPSYCNSNLNSKLTSIYFNIYNATVHPIDKLLLKIIYQHETNGYSILSESNYLWGKHSKESSSITQLLLSNTIFSGTIFENSINNYPFEMNTLNENKDKTNETDDLMEIDSDSDEDKKQVEKEKEKEEVNDFSINKEMIAKSYQEYSYDPSFILRLLTSLLDSYISEYSNFDSQQEDFRKENIENLWRVLQCFFYNGPFSFTVRSLSSKDVAIRQISYQILSKYQTLLDTYQEEQAKTLEQAIQFSKSKKSKSKNNSKNSNNNKSNFNNEKIIIKLIQVLKSSVFEKDQYIPPIFTLFYCLSIKVVSLRSDLKRKSIISYFKGISLLDLVHIPMFSLVLNFTLNKATIIWILEMISIALPDQYTETLLKKNNSISSLLGLFDSNVSNSKIKSLILEIILKLSNSSSGGLYLITKQGVLPWLSLLISNSSCPKSLFDQIFLIFVNITKNINNIGANYYNFNELSQISIILNNLLKLILNINWDLEFKYIINNLFKSLNLILNSNSSSIRLSTFDMVSLIKSYNSAIDKEFFESENERLELQESIVSIISYSKLSQNSQADNLFIFSWIFNLLNQTNINGSNNKLLNSILKWIQESLLGSRKQFIEQLNNNNESSSKLLNQLFFINNQIDILLQQQQQQQEFLEIKKLICNILILLLSESTTVKSILSKNYNQEKLLKLIDKIPTPANQKSDDMLMYKENINDVLLYIKNLFFN
ncbi:hypothetical protein DICPUDRAFT_25595 [Dictyostelium purpureum]|uniref:Nucleolar pre-ribosomal-associated protein 1 C-terminal domain-containing protein n=1 Tax=Dictyostelium purpureum TaxID=5786 RepID=F0Z7E0_DICPU|nr:uncharacterized protein DICPUDRAFT_25595 [Dictyostelium purpureum]EGC40124.1 hypothetical protein DICPUDRAFT_25595 [Dictyostelium purpureum]|eukprot:XP_003283314.1 hypothetical protein DICPUDRAFT_25595 [Dictyostelium purpureum]